MGTAAKEVVPQKGDSTPENQLLEFEAQFCRPSYRRELFQELQSDITQAYVTVLREAIAFAAPRLGLTRTGLWKRARQAAGEADDLWKKLLKSTAADKRRSSFNRTVQHLAKLYNQGGGTTSTQAKLVPDKRTIAQAWDALHCVLRRLAGLVGDEKDPVRDKEELVGDRRERGEEQPEIQSMIRRIMRYLFHDRGKASPFLDAHRVWHGAAFTPAEAAGEIRRLANQHALASGDVSSEIVIASSDLALVTAGLDPPQDDQDDPGLCVFPNAATLDDCTISALESGARLNLVYPYVSTGGAQTNAHHSVASFYRRLLADHRSVRSRVRIVPVRYLENQGHRSFAFFNPAFRFVLYHHDAANKSDSAFFLSRALEYSAQRNFPFSYPTSEQETKLFVEWWQGIRGDGITLDGKKKDIAKAGGLRL